MTLFYIFAHKSKLILPHTASLAGVGSHMHFEYAISVLLHVAYQAVLPYASHIYTVRVEPSLLIASVWKMLDSHRGEHD